MRKRRARGAGCENAERFRYVVVKCKYIHSRNTFVSSVDRLVYSEPLFPPDTLSNVLEKAATGKTVPTKAEEQSFLEPLIDPYNYENNYAPPKQQMWSTHLGTHRPPPPLLSMPRVVRTCAYLTLFALVHTSAFDPKTCGSGSLTEFKSNGMLITVDASTNTILTTQCGECPGTPTYREALDNSTARLRVMLSDISGGSDTQYTQLLVNVPFRITDTSGGDHFFYSASNMGNALCAGVTGYTPATGVGVAQIANACVVTELPTRLIRDIYGNGDGKYFPFTTFRRLIARTRLTFIFLQSAASTLGIHEWTHAYHTALPEAGDAVYEGTYGMHFPHQAAHCGGPITGDWLLRPRYKRLTLSVKHPQPATP